RVELDRPYSFLAQHCHVANKQSRANYVFVTMFVCDRRSDEIGISSRHLQQEDEQAVRVVLLRLGYCEESSFRRAFGLDYRGFLLLRLGVLLQVRLIDDERCNRAGIGVAHGYWYDLLGRSGLSHAKSFLRRRRYRR